MIHQPDRGTYNKNAGMLEQFYHSCLGKLALAAAAVGVLALIILFSLYILFVRPKGRHARSRKDAKAAASSAGKGDPRHAASRSQTEARRSRPSGTAKTSPGSTPKKDK